MNMEQMSIIPAPVEAMISGPGSFFGSCIVAANNFEATFQTAMADNLASASVAQCPIDFPALKSFSDYFEEYGENKVLGNLQAILGEKDGTEAFELALLAVQNDDALEQLSPKEQMDILRLFKIMEIMDKAGPLSVPKGLLEGWVKEVKNIFAELKIEFEQPEKIASEPEEDTTPLVAMPRKDFKNMKFLAKEMGIKPKDMPKFEKLVDNLLESGLITPKDLENAVKDIPQEKPVVKLIEGLWEFVKNEPETEVENLVAQKIPDLIYEIVSDFVKESLPDSGKESVLEPVKESVLDSVKESVLDSGKENVLSSAKENNSNPEKEIVQGPVKKTVFDSKKESVSSPVKEKAPDFVEEKLPSSVKKIIFDFLKANVSDLEKETFSSPSKGNFFGLIDADLAENFQVPEESELVQTFHALLRKLLRGELTEEEKEKLKHILKVAEHSNFNKQETLEEGDEVALEEGELEPQEKNKIIPKDPAEKDLAYEDLAFEEEVDLKILDSLVGSKNTEKPKRKSFRQETQQAIQAQPLQQTLQTPPEQIRQTQHVQHQVQPEVRAIWEVDGLRIEVVNPKTGEKLQTTHEAMPQRMQERINEFEVVRQVVAQAKFITTPTGEQKMTIQLRPDHLGQVDLRIALNHGEMQIHARVESVTAQSALETHIGLLREGLEKHGITLERLEVSVEQRDRQDAYSLAERQEQREQKHSNRRQHHRGREQHLAVSIKNESSDTGRRLGYNTMEYLA